MCLERESRKGEEPKTTSVPYVHRTTITTTTIIKKKKQKKGFQSKRCDEYYSDLAFSKRKIDKVVLENMNMQKDFGGRLRKRICYKRKTDNNNNNE